MLLYFKSVIFVQNTYTRLSSFLPRRPAQFEHAVDDEFPDLDEHDEGEAHPDAQSSSQVGQEADLVWVDGLLFDEGLLGARVVELETDEVLLNILYFRIDLMN